MEKRAMNSAEYSENSTDAVKLKTERSKWTLIMTYLVIWVLGVLVFWLFLPDDAGMLFAVVFLWITLPAATFVISFFTGRSCRGKGKWLAAPGFGVMYMLGEYATFSMANNVTFHKVNVPEFPMILYGAVISLAGMGIGYLVHHRE